MQTCRGKLGCSRIDRPFVLICSSSSSITMSTQSSNRHVRTHSHTNAHCLQQERTCPGLRPSKLITLPWWSGPVNLTRLQCWRETERIPYVSVTTCANAETINKMNRHKADSTAQRTMEMCIASSFFFSVFIGGLCYCYSYSFRRCIQSHSFTFYCCRCVLTLILWGSNLHLDTHCLQWTVCECSVSSLLIF